MSPHRGVASEVGDRVKPAEAELVVVDGLHRALGYWMAGHGIARPTCQCWTGRVGDN